MNKEIEKILEEILAFLNTSYRINRSLYRGEMADDFLNLSQIQLQAIVAIRYYSIMNMSELADHLLVTRPQLTKVVDGLVEINFVKRIYDPDNRRIVMLDLTDEGNEYIDNNILGNNGILFKTFENLDEDEMLELKKAVVTIRNVFNKLVANIEQQSKNKKAGD